MTQTLTQRPVNQIAQDRAIEFLQDETQGRIFSVYFRKVDGSMRKMTCRRGVKKHLVGGDLPYDPRSRQLLPVFDLGKKQYRMVNLATLVSFNVGGETFIVA